MHKVLALSMFGNLLFVAVLIMAYFVGSKADRGSAEEEAALLGPDFVPCVDAPLHFIEAAPESELGRALPNSIYIASDGLVRVRFEFTDENLGTLKEVTLSDKHGRPWIDANLEDGTLIYSRYIDDVQMDPEVSLRDKDGDGIPDLMVNWKLKASFEPEHELTWRRLSSGD